MSKKNRKTRWSAAPAWYRIALAARPEVDALALGEREHGIRETAKKLGVAKADTLRKYLVAARYADQFHALNPDLGPLPTKTPVAAVELIGRWAKYDPASAMKAGARLAQGNYPVAQLRADERKARLAYRGARAGRSGAHAIREKLKDPIRQLVQTGATSRYIADIPASHEPKKIDWLFRSEADPGDRIACVVFGPYGVERQYESKREDFLVRVLGLSRIFRRVVGIIALSSYRPQEEFEKWLDHYEGKGNGNITFHYVDTDTLQIHSPRVLHERR